MILWQSFPVHFLLAYASWILLISDTVLAHGGAAMAAARSSWVRLCISPSGNIFARMRFVTTSNALEVVTKRAFLAKNDTEVESMQKSVERTTSAIMKQLQQREAQLTPRSP